MEVVSYKVLNMAGEQVGQIDLDPVIFGAEVNQALVHQAVVWQRNVRRAGTHSTLTRAEMSGGGRKPWKQKGRGTARSGSNTSPVWVGGGVAHGPKPRSYATKFSKQMRTKALVSVLSDKVKQGSLVVLDSLEVESGKTKDFVKVLSNLGLGADAAKQGVAIVMPEKNSSVWRSSGNLKKVVALPVQGVNVYDLVKAGFLVSTTAGIEALQDRILGKTK